MDMLLPLHQAAAATHTQQQQEQQQQALQHAVLKKVQGFVKAIAAARHEQDNQHISRFVGQLANMHAALQQGNCAAAAAPSAAHHQQQQQPAGSSGAGGCSCSGVLRAQLVAAPDAAELLGLDVLHWLLCMDYTYRQKQLQQQHGQAAEQPAHAAQEAMLAMLEDGEVVGDPQGLEGVVDERCWLDYYRACVDAECRPFSRVHPLHMLQAAAAMPAGPQLHMRWEHARLTELLELHTQLSSDEAVLLADACCQVAELLQLLQACGAAAAGRKPMTLHRELEKESSSSSAAAVDEACHLPGDTVAAETAADVARGRVDRAWEETTGRHGCYDVLPGIRCNCYATPLGQAGWLQDIARAAGLAPAAAYGLAAGLAMEALARLPSLQHSMDAGLHLDAAQPRAKKWLQAHLQERQSTLCMLRFHLQNLVAAGAGQQTNQQPLAAPQQQWLPQPQLTAGQHSKPQWQQRQLNSLKGLLLMARGGECDRGSSRGGSGSSGISGGSGGSDGDDAAAQHSAADRVAEQLLWTCASHQVLLQALQEGSAAGPKCSLGPLHCPAAGHKWVAAAGALHRVVQRVMDEQMQRFLANGTTDAGKAQHDLQLLLRFARSASSMPSSSSAAAGAHAHTAAAVELLLEPPTQMVPEALPALLSALVSAVCSRVRHLLHAGRALQGTAAAVRTAACYNKACCDSLATKLRQVAEQQSSKCLEAFQQHQREFAAVEESNKQLQRLREQLAGSWAAWRTAVGALSSLATAGLQLLAVVLDMQLQWLLAAIRTCTLNDMIRQQQRQQVQQAGSSGRDSKITMDTESLTQLLSGLQRQANRHLIEVVKPSGSHMQLLWHVLPLLLQLGKAEQLVAELAGQRLVEQMLLWCGAAGSSGNTDSGEMSGMLSDLLTAAAAAAAAVPSGTSTDTELRPNRCSTWPGSAGAAQLQVELWAVEVAVQRAAAAGLFLLSGLGLNGSDCLTIAKPSMANFGAASGEQSAGEASADVSAALLACAAEHVRSCISAPEDD